MSLPIAGEITTVKKLVEGATVSSVGATLFVHKHCTPDEIEAIESELRPQNVELIDNQRTKIDL
jgi:hypothetical protein